MEETPTPTITKTSPTKPQNRALPLLLCFVVVFISFITIFTLTIQTSIIVKPSKQPLSLNPIIKTACSSTFYPSLCFSKLSLHSSNSTTLDHLILASINLTIDLVSSTRLHIIHFFGDKVLNFQEKNAFNDCIDMVDQTLYELREAIDELSNSLEFFQAHHHYYANLKTLLSAAMTNEITCIDGFSELQEIIVSRLHKRKGFLIYLEMKLRPIVEMISNSLAIIKHIEDQDHKDEELFISTQQFSSSFRDLNTGFPPWMSKRERRMMSGGRNIRVRANVVVASDGSGDFTKIQEAVKMAPNMSWFRFVIRIKRGVYYENLEIPRNKVNIMLIGDGINSTVISGNRSIVDGFSTFASATLTVIGDRFLARDLTVENTASPEKFQAVAMRVTSNAAFFRCNFTSNQDTLYAHSLRQFYRECVIQGTIDFIFGNAAAIFESCQILARRPIPGQSNMITAQSREDPNQNTGFSLQNCRIKTSPDFYLPNSTRFFTFLGRPWRNYSRTVILRSYLGNLIHPLGWSPWDQYSTLDTVEYIEYLNFGPGANTRFRVRWKGYKNNCTEDEAKKFTVGAFLSGPADWISSLP